MAKIKDIHAREILDSRGNPTLACEVILNDETHSLGFIPSGASTGANEALELRDGDIRRFGGRGVLKAVANVNTPIRQALIGLEAEKLEEIDRRMIDLDGTPNKSRLGANATLSVSLAVAKAASKSTKIPLYRYIAALLGKENDNFVMPIPFLNILNGGKHAVGSTDFQEFMIVPVKFKNFAEALRAGSEIYHALGRILEERSYQPLVGDEGGFAPALYSNEQAMEMVCMAIMEAKYHLGDDLFLALDPAASRFYHNGMYELHRENRTLTSQKMVDFYESWVEKYPIVAIEDGLAENDWDGWKNLTSRIGDRVETIGDDLYATNLQLLRQGIETQATTGILIKPNQIGTLTETLSTIKAAETAGFRVIISHRSGETEDDFIADLAVASGCGTIKAGAPCRSERIAKYNRLLEIETKEGEKAHLARWDTTNNQGFSAL